MRDEDGVKYLLGDHLGSTSLVLKADGTQEGPTLRYYPYGELRYPSDPSTFPTDYRFTGQREESHLGGLYHMGARFYDPYINRFLSPDTIIPQPANPQSFNRYSYVRNNPLKYIDPTGHQGIPPWPTSEPETGPPSLPNPGAETIRMTTGYDSRGLPGLFDSLTTDIGNLYLEAIGALNEVLVPAAEVAGSFLPGYDPVTGIVGISGTGRELTDEERVAGIAYGLIDLTPLDEIADMCRGFLPGPKIQYHHIFPQKWVDWFKDAGVEIHEYTIRLGQTEHLSGVHGRGGFVGFGDVLFPGRWNSLWEEFIENNPYATAKEIYQFAGQQMDEFGLSGQPIVPYPKKR